ncbi:MAG: methylthioribulose 1-phosphate dehydratase [Blastocatellia bacterium]
MTSSSAVAATLAELGRYFYGRGWVLGTSGNFSAVIQREPLRLAITASGVDKGALTAEQILQIDADARVIAGAGRPSDEARLHTAVVKARAAQAVLHTHSVWSTILSDLHAGAGGLAISGYEMLKGLEGVETHEHREWIPIVPNDQDMPRLAREVRTTLERDTAAHAFLLHRHGLYTWGCTLADAQRHVEILEFLLETVARTSGNLAVG